MFTLPRLSIGQSDLLKVVWQFAVTFIVYSCCKFLQVLCKHALQVMQQLVVVLQGLGNLGSLIPKITALAKCHVNYSVELAH